MSVWLYVNKNYWHLTDLGETRKSLCFQGSKINTQNFHYSLATRLIELLIKEIKEASFDVRDLMQCRCNDQFLMLSKASIPEIYQQQSIFPSYYDVEILEILLWCRIYSLHGQNRMDIFEGSRNERLKLIKADKLFTTIRWLGLSAIEKRM